MSTVSSSSSSCSITEQNARMRFDCNICVCVCAEKSQLLTWGFGILGKGPKLASSVTPEQIPETLFGANDFRENIELVDIQCGLHHFAVLTGTSH